MLMVRIVVHIERVGRSDRLEELRVLVV